MLTPGLEGYYDRDLDEPLLGARQIRTTGGFFRDSVDHNFGYFAVMARWVFPWTESVEASVHIGPGIIFRDSWRSVPGYNPNNALQESDDFLPGYEWFIGPLGEVDLLYRFSPTLQGVWSIIPGFPFVIAQSLGLRWEL